jgi:PAS domain S-box-containing protein
MDRSELELRAMQQQTQHAIIVLDAAGVVVEWNDAATALFGYTRDEMVGSTLEALFTPQDRKRGEIRNELASARSYGRGENDRWMLRKDGSRFWANGVVTRAVDASGSVIGFVKIVRDRTDIRTQLDTLQNRLQAADDADSRKNIFLATLAHELRSPMSAVATSARLISIAVADDQAVQKSVAVIERQVRHMSELVGDLAVYARAAEGQLKLDRRRVDLRSVIDEALETCGSALQAKRQTPEVLASGPIVLHADRLRLQQILVNLILNASKFTPAEGRIWIRATVEGEEAVVRVEDKGVGISADFLPHIFELFTQAGGSREASAQGGMGLGLPLVRTLVELHQGTVQARSDGLGKGTELTVRLPLAAREHEATEDQ